MFKSNRDINWGGSIHFKWTLGIRGILIFFCLFSIYGKLVFDKYMSWKYKPTYFVMKTFELLCQSTIFIHSSWWIRIKYKCNTLTYISHPSPPPSVHQVATVGQTTQFSHPPLPSPLLPSPLQNTMNLLFFLPH